jgi:DNA-binding PadR family transcriptional regulator
MPGKDLEKRIINTKFSIFLLWLISKKEIHGYELMKLIKSDKAMPCLAVSKLYPLLCELNRKGFISQKKVLQGRRVKKPYRITKKGRLVLKMAKEHFKRSNLMVQFAEDMLK